MKRLFLLILLMILLAQTLFAQLISHGSYSIVAYCREGIIVAADSRMGFTVAREYNPNKVLLDSIDKNPLAYCDGANKIFYMNGFAISHITLNSIGNHTINFYLKKFKEQSDTSVNVTNVIFKLYDFIQANYPEILNTFLTLKFQGGGYLNGIPYLIRNDPNTHIVYNGAFPIDKGAYILTDTLKIFAPYYSPKYSAKKMANVCAGFIRELAKDNGEMKVIGGAIRVVLITPMGQIKWIKNERRVKDYDTMSDFYKDYKNGLIKMTFSSTDSQKLFEIGMNNLFIKEGVNF